MLGAVQLVVGALSVLVFASMLASWRSSATNGSSRGLPYIVLLAVGGALADSRFAPDPVYIQAAVAILFAYTVVALLLSRTTEKFGPSIGAIWPLMLTWGWLLAVDTVLGRLSGDTRIAGRILAGVVLFLGVTLVRWSGVSLRTFAMAASMTVALIGVSVALIPDPWRACDRFKCGTFGSLLTGPFVSENFLGILAAWACALAILALQGAVRLTTVSLAVVLLLATGSRSSAYAVAAIMIGYWVLRRFSRHLVVEHRDGGRFRLSAWLSIATVGTGISFALVLLFTANVNTLSNRGAIWTSAIRVLRGNFLVGLGLDRWEPLTQLGYLPEHFPHNGYLLIIFSGGFVGLTLFAAVLWSLLSGRMTTRRAPLVRLCLLSLFMTISLTEVVWNPLTVDGLTWVILCLFVPVDATIPGPSASTASEQAVGVHPGLG